MLPSLLFIHMEILWLVESKPEYPSSVNCIHYMRNFCGFYAVNDDDSARKPLRDHKTKRLKMSLVETKFTFCSCSGD